MGHEHIPHRRCLGCGVRAPKRDLARFVAGVGADGRWELVPDDRSRMAGRGLYVCRRRACFEAAVRRRAFHRAARIGGERLAVGRELGDALEG